MKIPFFKSKSKRQNHEIFLAFLDQVFGREEQIFQHKAADGVPDVSVFVFRDLPENGMITGITYGLSALPQPEWKFGRPELIISMESSDIGWPFAAAYFAAEFRSNKRFAYGDVFSMDEPIAEDTKMNGFLVFAQGLLDKPTPHFRMNDFDLSFYQLYPIFTCELPLYSKIGLQGFWRHPDFDIYNPRRKPLPEQS